MERKPLIRSRKKVNVISEGEFTLASGLTLQLFPSIQNFNKTVWNAVVPTDNFFMQWDYLSAFEKVTPGNIKFHYALVSEGKNAMAAFYFQVVHLSADEISYILQPITSSSKIHVVGNGIREWMKKCREDNGFRLLVSGNNFISGEYGVGMVKGADSKKVFLALADTVKTITKVDRNSGKISAILVKDYFEKTVKENADYIRSKRYHRFLVEPEMIVPIDSDWKTFDDYIGAFSKKYRNRAKSVLKKTEVLKVVELEGEQLEKASPELFNLYRNVFERAKFKLSILHPDYFMQMKKAFPDKFYIYGYELDGKLVAFRSTVHLSTHLEAHFIGIDYDVNAHLPLYQRLLYDFIKDGIDGGFPKVFQGRTAAEMKSTVGAVPNDLVCYIRHRNGLSNQVIRPFIDYLKPSPWVPRNPFKDDISLTNM